MSECRPSGLRVSRQRCEVGGECRSDVLSHDESYARVDGEDAAGAQYHSYSHQCGRTLNDTGEYGAYDEEQQNGTVAVGVEASEELRKCLVVCQVHVFPRLVQCAKGEEHECHTEDKVTDVAVLLGVYEQQGNEERRPHQCCDIEREAR